jgi:hypothetical protein
MLLRFLLGALLIALMGIAAPVAHAQLPIDNTVVGADSDGDGLWDEDYALFLYAMGAKGALLPSSYSKHAVNFIKDWRRHAGLPSWQALKPDQRAYFSAWFWSAQEMLASADKPSRSLAVANNRNGWFGCYQAFRMPIKQMVGIGPFVQQVMQARLSEARVVAGQKATQNISDQVFEPVVPGDAEACRALLQALPFKAYPEDQAAKR